MSPQDSVLTTIVFFPKNIPTSGAIAGRAHSAQTIVSMLVGDFGLECLTTFFVSRIDLYIAVHP